MLPTAANCNTRRSSVSSNFKARGLQNGRVCEITLYHNYDYLIITTLPSPSLCYTSYLLPQGDNCVGGNRIVP